MAETSAQDNNVLFVDLNPENGCAEIESYCINCGENGITRLLLTKIPHFKEVILMAFECPHCGFKNNEIQSGQAMNEKGCTFNCQIKTTKDMNRQVVKSEFATIKIPELEFEIPPTARNGQLTTVEGIIQDTIDGLAAQQPQRMVLDPDNYQKIENFIASLVECQQLKRPFSIELYDPSGNSYVENLCAPKPDPQITVTHWERTSEDNIFLGIQNPPLEVQEEEISAKDATQVDLEELRKSVLEFPSNCYHCNAPTPCRMHLLSIPFFKEVVIMASACDSCGYKTNEVKSSGAVSEKGKKISLKLTDNEDLTRDILKSETCIVQIPEIDLELTPGTLGGKFTTVEGLLQQVHDEIRDRTPFMTGDSTDPEDKKQSTSFQKFLDNLQAVIDGKIRGTLILDDPLGNSYLQNLYAPDPDPNMTIEEYERTWDQNESLGLNDMKVNGEEEEESKEEEEEENKEKSKEEDQKE